MHFRYYYIQYYSQVCVKNLPKLVTDAQISKQYNGDDYYPNNPYIELVNFLVLFYNTSYSYALTLSSD